MLPKGWILHLGAAWLALAAAPVLAGPADGPGKVPESSGPTLEEALEGLRAEGIETLYTSHLVGPDLRLASPATRDGSPEERLRALLAPFGLAPRALSAGSWVVVWARSAAIAGCLTSDPGGEPIAGAALRLTVGDSASGSGEPERADSSEIRSDGLGCFEFADVAAAGRATLEVAGPGYRAHRQTLEIEAGAVHRVDISLRLEAETAEEIVVDARAGTLPAGAWLLDEGRQRSARLSGYDGLFSAAFSVPGIQRQAGGASFGMRGQGAERVSFVVDGIALVEPFHFRTLGSLAGTVTPGAVESVTFHRGQPPLTHGHRAGGVVEILTAAGRGGLTGRVGVSVESAEASLGGALARGALRWLAAYREGRPKFPETLAELDARPSYFDGLAKVAWALGQRHDLSLQTFTAGDEFVFTPPESPLGLEGFAPSLAIDQSSHHAAARYLLALGSRHALEAQFSDVEVDRQRFGFEIDDHNLGPDRPASFLLYERRETERTVGRLEGRSALSPSLDLRWGGASTRERTRYAYQGFVFYALASVPPDFEDRQDGSFLSATWRPRGDLTIDGGLRHDRSERLGESWLLPRASISLRRGGDGSRVWRLAWAEASSLPATDELEIPDNFWTLPAPEITEFLSLGYEASSRFGRLSVELYRHWIDEPRERFENLLKPVSRVPELELDRWRFAPEASRFEGLEVSFEARRRAWRGRASYELSRSEDRLEGVWRPRFTDRRHRLTAWASVELPRAWRADVQWRFATGAPTTAFDLDLYSRSDFRGFLLPEALGPINADRLPIEHALDLRLSRDWTWRSGLAVRAEIGVDNLYDRRPALGFALSRLRDPNPTLPMERGLGREVRWGVELQF